MMNVTIRRKDLSSQVVDTEVNRKRKRVAVHGRRRPLKLRKIV